MALRDGRQVGLGGADLISGAPLEGVVAAASEAAAGREIRGGEVGVGLEDLAEALDRDLRGRAGLLTPASVRGYVARLPQEVDAVRVEVLPSGPPSGRYIRTA